MTFDRFLHLLRALERERVEYILVGATALGVHGIVRATEDIDLFVRPLEDNIVRLKRAMRTVWDDPDIEQISAADLAGDYPTVRYVPPDASVVVDLLARLGSEFQYDDLEATTVEVEGVRVREQRPELS